MTTDAIELAVLKTELGYLKEKVDSMSKDMKDLQSSLDALTSTLDRAKGSWQALATVGSICAAIGASFSWVFDHFMGK